MILIEGNQTNSRCLCADLKAEFEVRLEEGLDTFVVFDGLPIVSEDNKAKLIKFLLKKIKKDGPSSSSIDPNRQIFLPMNENGMSEG